MKLYIASLFFLIGLALSAQIVTIPDADFKSALVNDIVVDTDGDGSPDADADINNDGEIQESEALAVIYLYVNDKNISNLTGIEEFTNLVLLFADDNLLSQVDISNNLVLRFLSIQFNLLESIDVSNNASLSLLDVMENKLDILDVTNNLDLITLDCRYNAIQTLDVSQNFALERLFCSYNLIAELDVSSSLQLSSLTCRNNQITSLDVSSNYYLELLSASNNNLQNLNLANNNNNFLELMGADINPNLTCIQVSSLAVANSQPLWFKDATAEYRLSCELELNNYTSTGTIYIYPNPVSDLLIISSPTQILNEIEIFSINGSLIKKERLNNSSLEVSTLPSGVYFLKIKNQEQEVLFKKFIKK